MDAQIEFHPPSFPSNEIFSRLARNVPITLFSEIASWLPALPPSHGSPVFSVLQKCLSVVVSERSCPLHFLSGSLFKQTVSLANSSSPPPFFSQVFFFTLSLVWLSDLSGCNLALHPLFLSLFSISTSFQACRLLPHYLKRAEPCPSQLFHLLDRLCHWILLEPITPSTHIEPTPNRTEPNRRYRKLNKQKQPCRNNRQSSRTPTYVRRRTRRRPCPTRMSLRRKS